MKSFKTLIAGLILLQPPLALAEIPNTFVAGEAAVAEHVNQNFDYLEQLAVEVQAELETEATNLTSNIETNTSAIEAIDTRVEALESSSASCWIPDEVPIQLSLPSKYRVTVGSFSNKVTYTKTAVPSGTDLSVDNNGTTVTGTVYQLNYFDHDTDKTYRIKGPFREVAGAKYDVDCFGDITIDGYDAMVVIDKLNYFSLDAGESGLAIFEVTFRGVYVKVGSTVLFLNAKDNDVSYKVEYCNATHDGNDSYSLPTPCDTDSNQIEFTNKVDTLIDYFTIEEIIPDV